MPQVFKIAGYTVYFWVNEKQSARTNHVHYAAFSNTNMDCGKKSFVVENACNNSKVRPACKNNLGIIMQIIGSNNLLLICI